MDFKKIDPKSLSGNVFEAFDSGWALLTAGTEESYNTMTISWGGLGWLWRKPMAFIVVRKSRHTHQFIESNSGFTVSFFDKDSHRKELGVLGSKSGRDIDKMNDSGLTPIWIEGQPAYNEARSILVCNKIYKDSFSADAVPQYVIDECYEADANNLHDFYIAEVISAYEK